MHLDQRQCAQTAALRGQEARRNMFLGAVAGALPQGVSAQVQRVRLVAVITDPATVRQILEDASEPATALAIALARSLLLVVNGQQLIAPEAVVPIPEQAFGQTLRS